MHGGKADIKSKKTKLQEKRQDKLKNIAKPIQISSEEEEQLPLPVQKRRSTSSAPQPQTKPFNLFNIDRLKKVEPDPLRTLQPLQLTVEENVRENPLQHTDARALFTYRIEGN